MIKLFYGDVVNDPERKIIIIVFCEAKMERGIDHF